MISGFSENTGIILSIPVRAWGAGSKGEKRRRDKAGVRQRREELELTYNGAVVSCIEHHATKILVPKRKIRRE